MSKSLPQRGRCFVAVGMLVLSTMALVSCATDVANRYYGSVRYEPRSPKDVAMLSAEPSRPYDVIADFQSRNESRESIRKKAAKIGADAVIITMLGGEYSESEQWAEQKHDRGVYTRIVGTAIKYKQERK